MRTHLSGAAVLVPAQIDSTNAVYAHSSDSHLEWPFSQAERTYPASLAGKGILLAYDDSAEAQAAARVADALATAQQARVSVVSVVDTTPVPIPFPLDAAIAMGYEKRDGTIHRDRERATRDRLHALLDHPIAWATSIDLGIPSDVIAHRAASTHAALVVMGLRRHGRVDRALHDETVLSVMRKAASPVLGVVADTVGLPTSALVAMDFSPASVRAAALAATLLAPGGRMTLAYVQSTMMEYAPDTTEGVLRSLGVEAAFERLERAFASDVLRVDHVVLHHVTSGANANFLIDLADGGGFDLLVAGSARHGRIDRILLGSVSADLVRDGRYSVLIVPPDDE